MIVIPIIWLVRCRQYIKTMSRKMLSFSMVFITIGLCSVYFHATLSMLGQLLDDWSILWGEAIGTGEWTPTRVFPNFCNGNRYFTSYTGADPGFDQGGGPRS